MTARSRRGELTAAMQRLEADVAEELTDHLADGASLPGAATWPPEQLTLDDDPHGPLLVQLDGFLVEVEVEVHVTQWRPPGWAKVPPFAKGDVVMVSGPSEHRWVVREVLGTREDPRPGYLLDFVTSLDPFDYQERGRIALPTEVFAPLDEREAS